MLGLPLVAYFGYQHVGQLLGKGGCASAVDPGITGRIAAAKAVDRESDRGYIRGNQILRTVVEQSNFKLGFRPRE